MAVDGARMSVFIAQIRVDGLQMHFVRITRSRGPALTGPKTTRFRCAQ
jgi:hypothetical protein